MIWLVMVGLMLGLGWAVQKASPEGGTSLWSYGDWMTASSMHDALGGRLHRGDQPVPVIQHGAWRLLLGVTGWHEAGPGMYRWSGWVGGMLLLFLLLRWVMKLRPGDAWFGLFAGGYLVVAPPWLSLVGMGGSDLVTALLVVGACLLHLRRASGPVPLSFGAAFLIGLLSAQRMEGLFLWLLMCLHGLITGAGEGRATRPAILLRGVTGLAWVGVGIAPLVGWNVFSLGPLVPWPEFPGAPLGLSGFVGEGGAIGVYLHWLAASVPVAYGRFWSAPAIAGVIPFLLMCAAMGYWTVQLIRGALPASCWFMPLTFFVLPGLVAMLLPVTGWNGVGMLADAVSLLWLPVLAWSAWDGTLLGLRRFSARIPPAALTHARTLGLMTISLGLLVHGFSKSTGELQRMNREAADREWWRQAWPEQAGGGTVQVVATDRPEWFGVRDDVRVLDLTRETSPRLYAYPAFLSMTGEAWSRMVREREIEVVVLWSSAYRSHGQEALGLAPYTGDGEEPRGNIPLVARVSSRR
ncbi:MAG TPA: hypothetical protein PKE55_06770 [Kiritimatiellia bacterium]|nr:hypothetical protein [Kiritimatiellia bacterium]